MKNITKFTKLMQMTFSSNDNEALMAIRAANKILEKNNFNWDQFLQSLVRPIPRREVVVNFHGQSWSVSGI